MLQLSPACVPRYFLHDCHSRNSDSSHYRIFSSENTHNTVSSTLTFCNYIQFFSQFWCHRLIYKLKAQLRRSSVRYATKMMKMSLWWCFIRKNSNLSFSWTTSWRILSPGSFRFRILVDRVTSFSESFRTSFRTGSGAHLSWNCSIFYGSPWPWEDASLICMWALEMPTQERFNNFRFIV